MSQQGRKQIKGSEFTVKAYEHIKQTQRFVFNYMYKPRFVFKKGNLKIKIHKRGVRIMYYRYDDVFNEIHDEIDIPIIVQDRRTYDELITLMQDFILHCFYEYERNPYEKVKLHTLAYLLNVNFQRVSAETQTILEDRIQDIVIEKYAKTMPGLRRQIAKGGIKKFLHALLD